jgi:hypothetical protein
MRTLGWQSAAREQWNRPDDPYPITAIEFNWHDESGWSRAYSDFDDGCHRGEHAVKAGVPYVWLRVVEYRFMPPGVRPPDRADVW